MSKPAERVHEETRVDGLAPVAVRSWQVRWSSEVGEDGSLVSDPAFRADRWHVAPARSTAMGALLASGLYEDIGYSTNLREAVDPAQFAVPWWFRTTFRVVGEGCTIIQADGIIPRADLWVNGSQVADSRLIAGAYTSNCVDISEHVKPGLNAAAFLVYPGNPNDDLSIGWVDWNQWPPDNNMGVWRDVWIRQTGPVALAKPRVTSNLSADLSRADLEATVEATNLSTGPVTLTLVVSVAGPGAQLVERQEIELAAGECRRLAAGFPIVTPAVWWPAGLGDQPLYHVRATALVDRIASETTATTFGIRRVESHVAPGGGRQFVVNGQPIQIRGGGWSPDLFLRNNTQRVTDELAMALHAGLNTIRLEGKGENAEFFGAADASGMLVLPGWECCDKWEAHAGTGGTEWDDHDFDVAARSMSGEAYRLGNHPCVLGFFIGSDFPPEPRAAELYVGALREARWDLPVISSATTEGCDAAGPSGMKMTGPYAWVPPSYWWRTDPELGGAVGFNSETSAGNNLPRLPSLRRMLSGPELDELWARPETKQFHAGPPSPFDNLAIFGEALAARYGSPRSLEDFAQKAQLSSYEAVRAQFEAFAGRAFADEPATGVVYWMLNSAWPSLNWQLWDHYLDASAAYYAARKALEPLHIQYDYERQAAMVRNDAGPEGPLLASVTVRQVSGGVVSDERFGLEEIAARTAIVLSTVKVPDDLGPTYFLELALTRAGEGAEEPALVSRNVYWLSSVPDVLAIADTTWQYTPCESFADLRGLASLQPPRLAPALSSAFMTPGLMALELTVDNPEPGGAPALGVHATVVGRHGEPIVPALWDDNDIVIFAGQSAVLRCEVATSLLPPEGGAAVEVEYFGSTGPLRISL